MECFKLFFASACLVATVGQAHAAITGVTGAPANGSGGLPSIISAPTDVLDGCISGTGQLGFDEAQGVVTLSDFNADDGVVVPAGTLVDSHLLFFNLPGGGLGYQTAVWTFKRPIIAVMSTGDGKLEGMSTPELGAPGTNYAISPSPNVSMCRRAAPFAGRGLETTPNTTPYKHRMCPLNNDCYIVDGNTLTLYMQVSQPGDWIRVITAGALKAKIDVKPGSDPNCFNVNGKGVIPVAILGSVELDVSLIEPASLNFAGLSVRTRGNGKQQCSISDANSDGYDDLVCQFQDDASHWSADGTTAELNGLLVNGTPFEGADTICMVPAR